MMEGTSLLILYIVLTIIAFMTGIGTSVIIHKIIKIYKEKQKLSTKLNNINQKLSDQYIELELMQEELENVKANAEFEEQLRNTKKLIENLIKQYEQ